MKANIQDMMLMMDKKPNSDECWNLNFIKTTLQKHMKEQKQVKEE